MNLHKQVPYRDFFADEEVVPLLDWLYSFNGVKTYFSCQGTEYDGRRLFHPYIIFACCDKLNLDIIMSVFLKSPYMDIRPLGFDERICVTWESVKQFREFLKLRKVLNNG